MTRHEDAVATYLGKDDRATDGGGHLLGALDAQAHVPIVVTHHDECLEARALAGARLLLHGHDLHHLILELLAQKVVDDLILLDGEGKQVDLLQAVNLALLYQAAQLCDGRPLFLLPTLATAATATASPTPATPSAKTTLKATWDEVCNEDGVLLVCCWCICKCCDGSRLQHEAGGGCH